VYASRFIASRLLRGHWRATLVLGVGLGLAAAVPVTAWGVARRTDHAFPAFRAFSLEGLGGVRGAAFCPDTAAGCQSYNPVAEQQTISHLPGIVATTRQASVITSVSTAARPDPQRTIVEAYYDEPLAIAGGVMTSSGRALLVAGRIADFDAPDEVMANEAFLASRRAKVGETIQFAVYGEDEFDAAGEGSVPPLRAAHGVRIVGVIRQPTDLDAQDVNGGLYTDFGHLLLGPGVLRTFDFDVASYGIAIGIVPSDPNRDVEAAVRNALPGRTVQFFAVGGDTVDQLDAIGRSVHLQASGARAFALTSMLAALVFGGQALARQLRRELDIRETLSALGMRSSDVQRATALRTAPIVAVAVFVCVTAAVLASPIGPVGIARKSELHPGVHFDWLTLIVGGVAVVFSVLSIALFVGRPTRTRVVTPAPMRISTWIGSVSASASAGVAYLRPASARRVQGPRRTAFGSCVIAAAAAVAAAVLVASLSSLVDHPTRYGFTWDAVLGNFGSQQQADDGTSRLRSVPHITSASELYTLDSQLEGRYAPLLAFADLDGYLPTTLPVTQGRLPVTKSEIALAEPLAAALHKHIGDLVEVSIQTAEGVRTENLTLVGHVVVTALFPAIDPKNGVIVHPSLITETDTSAQNLVVRIDPTYRNEASAALKKAFPNTYSTAVPPTDVRNLQRLSSVPTLLALVIGILAAASYYTHSC